MDVWPNYTFTADSRHVIVPHQSSVLKVALDSGDTQKIAFRDRRADLRASGHQGGAHRHRSGARAHPALDNRVPGRQVDRVRRIRRRVAAGIAAGKPVGSPKRLTSGTLPAREYTPAFSPDGRSIAYVTWSDTEGGQLWTAPIAGSAPRQLTRAPGHYANPSWSPKGDRLALIRGSVSSFVASSQRTRTSSRSIGSTQTAAIRTS